MIGVASYQRGRGRPSIFRAQISRGSQIALHDPKALFVFSGGYTSPLSATSEGEAYLRFARAMGLLPPADRFTRAATEDASLGLVPKRVVFRRPSASPRAPIRHASSNSTSQQHAKDKPSLYLK
ncbi:hypothetical protein EDB85DRAFT_2157099 [Lactarius pseudohatsudake]|nr:hypothetical protein EDB85DRAFT_2157099 [Lactarius pseudohatsudake]